MTTVAKKVIPIKPLPADVLAILAEQHKRLSQVEMAEQLGVSTSTVNKAVHDKFQGDLDKFCARVRGLWGGQSVECPVLGEINAKLCLDQQRATGWSNPMRASLSRTCPTCPHRHTNQTTTKPTTTTHGGQHA